MVSGSVFKGKSGVLLIAEIGGNHEGDFKYACQLTEQACRAGADVVKFQIYTGETLVSKIEDPERVKHFDRFALTTEQYILLAKLCKQYGARFNASVWDLDALSHLDEYLDFYKIGSGDLTAYPVLKKIAEKGKPIIVSTGLSTFDEVKETIQFLRSCNSMYEQPEMLAVLQCTSMYPIPDQEANINVVRLLKKEFGCTVGYSDHTVGSTALEVAVSAGAEVLELHFTDSREGKTFRDHQVSLTAIELRALSEKIVKIKKLLGDGNKAPTISEVENDHVRTFRRSVYLSHDMKAGEAVSEADLITLRPNNGVDARDYLKLIGKKLKKDIKATESFQESDFYD